MKLFSVLAIAVLVTGCRSPVPANRINITTPRGSYRVDAPKNVDISGFKADVDTNGTFSVSFQKWTSTNDANVIDRASAGRIAEVQAWNALLGTLAEKAVQGAGKAAVP